MTRAGLAAHSPSATLCPKNAALARQMGWGSEPSPICPSGNMVPGSTLDTGHSQGTKRTPQFHGAYLPVPNQAVNTDKAREEDKMGPQVMVGPRGYPSGAENKSLIWVDCEEDVRQESKYRHLWKTFLKGELRNVSAVDKRLVSDGLSGADKDNSVIIQH